MDETHDVNFPSSFNDRRSSSANRFVSACVYIYTYFDESSQPSAAPSEAIITRHYNVGTLIIAPAELSRDLLDLVKSGNLYNAKCRRKGTFDPE